MTKPVANVTRRKMLAAGGAGAALIASPAVAQSQPKIKWRCTSSFPKSLDTFHGNAQVFVKAVKEMTGGNFEIEWFAPGEIVPAFAVVDAVQASTVEMGQTGSFYYIGKNPAFQFGTGLPFGMNQRGHNAWLTQGGGNEMMNDFYKGFKIYGLNGGNTNMHMAGWFRKEIKSVDDLKGLKMRISGMAGTVFAKAGGVPQQLPGGEVYAALERGTIDGTKWITPVDDEKLGFYKVAPYYYYPGWNDGSASIHYFINLDKWESLPKEYQAVMRSAAALAGEWVMTKFDADNPKALRRLVSQGTKLRGLPQDVVDALHKAAQEVYAETSEKNPTFKAMYESYTNFAKEFYLWFGIGEATFDAMMIRYLRSA